jgi:putative Mg2+ transporter-C (MgtC) family protein
MTPEPANWPELLLRIGCALMAGVLVGINRDLHHKPIGLRTLGLVSLGTCLLILSVSQYAIEHGLNSSDAASRVTQGVVSGIGFLGAGAILHGRSPKQVHGMTTAAAIWAVAALGAASALAQWPILLIGFGATLILLILGGPVERLAERLSPGFQASRKNKPPDSDDASG